MAAELELCTLLRIYFHLDITKVAQFYLQKGLVQVAHLPVAFEWGASAVCGTMVNGRLAGTTAAVLVLLQLPAARTETAQTCGIGEATLSLSLKGAGVTEPGLW